MQKLIHEDQKIEAEILTFMQNGQENLGDPRSQLIQLTNKENHIEKTLKQLEKEREDLRR